MHCRKLFTPEELEAHLNADNLQQAWALLNQRFPSFFGTVWRAHGAPECKKKAEENGWTPDEVHQRLMDGLAIFHWTLGSRITNELLAIGQNPMLASLMGVKEHLLNKEIVNVAIDLQAVLLLVVVRDIANAQDLFDPDYLILQLLDELQLEDHVFDVLAHTAIRVEMVKRELGVSYES